MSDKKEKILITADVMGINPKLFEGAMGVLHDLTGHCQGKRYTIVIDVEPDSVRVKKILREVSDEDKKAIEDICTILNGKNLDRVETILQTVRQKHSQAVYCSSNQLDELDETNLAVFCKKFEAFCKEQLAKVREVRKRHS